jgi:ABC-2 type transport system permease protein
MWTILKIELFKIFKRPRTYIAFAAIGIIIILIQLAFYLDGESYIDFMISSASQSFNIEGKKVTAFMVSYVILQTLLLHVPLLIALIGGDMIAGEANMGTLRLLMSKPVGRASLLLSKFAATSIYTILLLIWMALLALGISLIVFGPGDMINMKSNMIIILESDDLMWRYFAAFGFAAIAMTTVAALSFLLSIFAENSIGPIVATMSIVIICTILTTMDLPLFNEMKPFLFTSHMLGWKAFFDDDVNYASIFKSAGVLLFHVVAFVTAAIVIFKKKDVLS